MSITSKSCINRTCFRQLATRARGHADYPDQREQLPVQLVLATEQAPFTSNIVIVDLQTGNYQNVTEGFADTFPVWSPDQRHIVFVRGDTLMLIQTDGSGEQSLVRLPGTFSIGLAWKAEKP